MERWQNRVAVVTGASSGVGAACCRHLLTRDMTVVGLARQQEVMIAEVQTQLTEEQQTNFHGLRCDITKEEEVLECFAWIESTLGGIDAFINCAGVVMYGSNLLKADNSESLKSAVDTNVMGVTYCTREAFLSMQRRDVDGQIILINGSGRHSVPIIPNLSTNIHTASKHAQTAMTEFLRQEILLEKTRVKVTSIFPGIVNTTILPDYMTKNTAMLAPEDIADAVVYILQTPPHVQIDDMTIRPVGGFN